MTRQDASAVDCHISLDFPCSVLGVQYVLFSTKFQTIGPLGIAKYLMTSGCVCLYMMGGVPNKQ